MTEFFPLPQRAACPCGISHFELLAKPFARFICHCRICQAYTGRAFSDVTALKASQVNLPKDNRVVFKKYRPPPNISRGSCSACGKSVIEFGKFGPLALAFVPVPNVADPGILPPPCTHIFYHRRLADALDDLPKYSGYFWSQLAVLRLLLRGLRNGNPRQSASKHDQTNS
jgi:hypothetical protein